MLCGCYFKAAGYHNLTRPVVLLPRLVPMKTSLFKSLYFQNLTAIAIGILTITILNWRNKMFGDAFVKLIKMIIAPVIIFCTVVTGTQGMESMKAVWAVPARSRCYFEIVSTIALDYRSLISSTLCSSAPG